MTITDPAVLDAFVQDMTVWVSDSATRSDRVKAFHLWEDDCPMSGVTTESMTVAVARERGLGLCSHCVREAEIRAHGEKKVWRAPCPVCEVEIDHWKWRAAGKRVQGRVTNEHSRGCRPKGAVDADH